MEMKHSSASYESKRKAQKEEANETSLFKKARYEWQIKGESSKDAKIHKYCTTEVQLGLDRTEQDIVTCSKLQEDAASTKLKLITGNNASFQSEIKHVNNPDFTSQGHTSSSEKGQRCGDFSHVSLYNGHPAGTFESPKYRGTLACVDPVVSDRTASNNSLQTFQITQTKESSSALPELHATDQSDIDTNLDSRGAFVGLSSNISSISSRRAYNPRSSTTSTNSNELQFDSFLAKRQNSHIAKAVVDNAINKTLEDMGVSPDNNNDSFVNGKCNVEDAGISQAIQSRGLIPQHQTLDSQDIISQHQAVCGARLAPILSHVTHLSDMVFSQGHFQPNCLADTQDIILDQNSTFAATSVATSVSASSSDLLDQAVSMAISSRGLALQRDLDVL
ncbi:uncharacterized protein LOC110443144 [Mizuhopecten yessoensis]|uniref:Uncharacterized protein n=1 Tax=Mizuhopecten yessoensis TaxID=6573 RepID=A0A210PFJ7_MIZYE|nr:uncharacterized protein LOC110443144 [Mizuhopecten yessoensis]OWF35259.1 hypothetical protein KP79_PYT14999 [Mizuhopecten yessoensis]